MSAFKKLNTRNVSTEYRLVERPWSASLGSNNFGIEVYDGQYVTESLFSSSVNFTKKLYYDSIKHLYFSGPVSGSISSSYYEFYEQDTDLESLRYDITGTRTNSSPISNVAIISIPKSVYGLYIKPGSFNLQILGGEDYIENEGDYVLETVIAGGQYIIPN